MSESNIIHKHSAICALPNEVVVHSAAYLPLPSRALLAVSQYCSPEAAQAIIAQTKWESLDFGLLDTETASKLTDDVLASIPNQINARDNLKTLKLTGCTGIDGSGVNPLRNSTVLQELDLDVIPGKKKSPETMRRYP